MNAASNNAEASTEEPIIVGYEILENVQRNVTPFTQGLEVYDGHLYESSGIYGESTLRIYDPFTGEVIVSQELPEHVFGEGLTVHNNRIYILTWKAV
ncbi:MAG TPA: glutaminyl-peptide cyclotransferase, partial [Candidatus Poseidoniales archaeon]